VADVEIYTGYLCGYCFAAKRLLRRKGIPYREINVSLRPTRRAEMMDRASGGYTVPQIFIDGRHIGGCDDLMALNAEGKLDPLLNSNG
jgi:glutaredoxin 3